MDLCPHGDSAEPQPGCVCRAQLRAGLTHEGRFPLQQHQPQLWQPWMKPSPSSEGEHENQALGTGGHRAALLQTRTHSQWKRCWEIHTWGSTYTSPVPCLQEMCIPREVPLPWQHQPHDTALCEESGSAHSGHTEEAAQAALPHSESQHSHQVAHKIFSFFFL